MITVGVLGAAGKMGQTVCEAVLSDPDLELVAAIDPAKTGAISNGLKIESSIESAKSAGAQVLVDFTVHESAVENLKWCAANDVHAVVGTTGFTDDELAEFSELFASAKANAIIAPNFAVGAVLMMRFAEQAAPHFNSVEIIELHHDQKADAPSGTAVNTAKQIAQASKVWNPDPTKKLSAEGARGATVDGIPVHSIRLNGLVAHQEVIFGTAGQSLTIRHDSYDRSSFMPGVLLAVKAVPSSKDLTVGLESLL